MAKQRIIFISIICLSIAGVAVQVRWGTATKPPRLRDMRGMTAEEREKAYVQQRNQAAQQRLRSSEKRHEQMAREAWKRLLRVSEQRWKSIEPKNKQVMALRSEARVRSKGGGGLNKPRYDWKKHSEIGGSSAKAPHEMSDGERLVDELIDLLRDENSKDEEIRKKIDAIQQVRAKARAALPQAKKELAAVLTNPRQEAIFLVLGSID